MLVCLRLNFHIITLSDILSNVVILRIIFSIVIPRAAFFHCHAECRLAESCYAEHHIECRYG